MADMKKLLHTFDEADELLNGKINRTNLSTIVASATASVENKKTVLIRGTGRNIESLKVSGRTVQDGLPTPTNPVEVKGVGDKTVNLFDKSQIEYSKGFNVKNNIIENTSYADSGIIYIPITPSKTITLSGLGSYSETYGNAFCDKDKNVIDIFCTNNVHTATKTAPSNAAYVLLTYHKSFSKDTQVEYGSTATPYEPYGKYKIPVSCNGEATNVYLDAPLFDGEVADLVSGKAEKKYGMIVFDGSTDESWTEGSYPSKKYYATDVISDAKKTSTIKCSYNSSTSTVVADENVFINDVGKVVFCTQGLNNVDALKTMLAANPMIVVYPLYTTTTESFDGATIPTTAAEQDVNINTELVPSSIEVVAFGDYYTKSEVDKMVNDLQPMFYSSLDTNKVRVTFDSFPTDRIYMINIRFTVDGNTFVCNLSSPRNSVNSQYFTTFTRYGGKNHTVTGYLNLALENKEVVATLLNVELDGESIANPTVTRLILSCIK